VKHTHPHGLKSSSEVYIVVSGTGCIHAGEGEPETAAGLAVLIEPGEVRWLENTGSADPIFLVIVEPYWRAGNEELVVYPEIPEP